MRNSDIIFLVNAGVRLTTAHTLPAASAYKAYKFRKAVGDALNAISASEQGLLQEAGIAEPGAFDARVAELNAKRDKLTADELAELDGLEKKLSAFLGLRAQLYEEEADLEGVKRMTYADWRLLQDENKAVKGGDGKERDVFSGRTEELLEGVLWEAPEED